MSHASAQIRYPDGTIRWAEYNGTVDVLMPAVYETMEELGKHWRQWPADDRFADGDEVFDVVVYSHYGRGFYWPSKATLTRVRPDMPFEHDDVYESMSVGWPGW